MKNAFNFSKNSALAFFIFLGAVIGAGVFGLPFVVSKAGIIPGLFYFLSLSIIALLLHLFFGEIILRTQEKHRLVGYVEKYIGKKWKPLISISVIASTTGVLLAYLVAGGAFFKIMFSSFLPVPERLFTVLFWLLCAFLLFFGKKMVAKLEIATNILFFAALFFILFFCASKFNIRNIPLIDTNFVFLPYGVILFSFAGWTAIPEAAGMLKEEKDKKNLKKILIFCSFVVALFYIAFSFLVAGASGRKTSEESFTGLVPLLGTKIVFWGAFSGALTLIDSFLIIGLYLINTFIYDFKINRYLAFSLVCAAPLVLFFCGFTNFIGTIGLVGSILGATEAVMIVLIFKKAKIKGDRIPEYSLKIPDFMLYFLVSIFLLAALIELIYFLK